MKKILIAGGAGYVGSILVPKLLEKSYHVTVIDLMIFGDQTLPLHESLETIKGDINDKILLEQIMEKQYDCIINLAVVTDDSWQINLEKIRQKTNLDACFYLAYMAKLNGVKRFIYASSTSVYGNSTNKILTEESKVNPLTDYAFFKVECEKYLLPLSNENFAVCCVRPSTVFGYSPRQRFDLLINNFTMTACLTNKLIISGKEYIRPNIHIEDLADLYIKIIEAPTKIISGQIFNVVSNNFTIEETANKVEKILNFQIDNIYTETTDHRSYQVSSKKIKKLLGFNFNYTIDEAVKDMAKKLKADKFNNPLHNCIYFNKKIKNYMA